MHACMHTYRDRDRVGVTCEPGVGQRDHLVDKYAKRPKVNRQSVALTLDLLGREGLLG